MTCLLGENISKIIKMTLSLRAGRIFCYFTKVLLFMVIRFISTTYRRFDGFISSDSSLHKMSPNNYVKGRISPVVYFSNDKQLIQIYFLLD